MKTRYTPLLEIKKNDLDRCERDLQQANAAFNNAQVSLKEAYATLESLQIPQHGTIQDMLSARTYISSQRMVVNDKKNWLTFAQNQVELAAQKVKKSNIEYEKFKYLDYEEIKKIEKLHRIKESKELDEIAVMTHNRKGDI